MWSVRGSAASAAVESPLRLPASRLQWCHVHWCVRRVVAVTVAHLATCVLTSVLAHLLALLLARSLPSCLPRTCVGQRCSGCIDVMVRDAVTQW